MKYFIGFVATIFLIILLVILLATGGNSGSKAKVPATAKTLDSYADTDATVRMTIDGPVQADQTHQQIRLTVGRDNATFEQIDGYTGNVVATQNYANNSTAYATFLRSLSLAGYNNGDSKTKELQDERGVCALGNRYIFEIDQDGKTLQRFWTTSCNKSKTFKGNTTLVMSLFQKQIPDYSKLRGPVTGIAGSSIF